MKFNRIFIFLLFVGGTFGTFWLLSGLLPIFRDQPQTLSLLLVSVGLLLAILASVFFFRFAFRGWQADFQTLKSGVKLEGGKLSETEFALETFQNLLLQVQTQKRELARLNEIVSQRAESAELFSERIVAGLPSGLIAFNEKGETQILNAPAREILELAEDAATFDYKQVLSSIEILREKVEKCLSESAIFRREEIAVVWKNGKTRHFGITVAPIESVTGETRGALCQIADLTEINELRSQIALKQNLESLGEMSAGLAHEFKNSLATLQSYAQLLQRSNLDERGKLASDALLSEVRNLSEMITAFLNFARPRDLNLSEVDTTNLIKSCVEELADFFAEKNVKPQVSGKFPVVKADERLLRQTFLNLMRNATEAIDDDTTERTVKIRGAKVKKFLSIEIEDSGKGIAEKDLNSIFIPFFTTKTNGHGIGLALAHRVVTQHGGTLTARNRQDKTGAIFTVKLPI